jgi:endonuclease/exonuclease/phosphatase family metal-dependent hydrolase
MKNSTIGLLVGLLTALLTACSGGGELKVITFNVRYDNPLDSLNSWPNRAAFVADWINTESPDLIGLQEVLWHQYEFLSEELTGFSSVATGRDDGLRSGEASPVFFRKERFEELESGTFWLSEAPDVPGSLGPGAVLPRIVTWVHLKETSTGRKLWFFNTHFSHVSDSARIMSAIILSGAVRKMAHEAFFVLTGDFNLRPDSRAYEVLTGEGAQYRVLYDSYLLSSTPPAGADYTFNGFSDKPGTGRIDYIFYPAATKVLSHETLILKKDRLFISDHWPVRSVVNW